MALNESAGRGVPSGLTIPPRPKVLNELHELIAKDSENTPAIARLIAGDPGISSLLFKAARSSVFGGGQRKCDTLEQALVALGTRRALNLISAFTFSRSLSGERQRALDHFWLRATEIAQFAALIAADRSINTRLSADQAYLVGMFHECGVPVLMMRFPDYCKGAEQISPAYWKILPSEDERFAVDHCSVGYLVARHWSLPDYVAAAIQRHLETQSDSSTAANYNAVALVQLARQFYFRLVETVDPVWNEVRETALAELGIHVDAEQEYFDEISERFLAKQI